MAKKDLCEILKKTRMMIMPKMEMLKYFEHVEKIRHVEHCGA